jgi:ssDNA-binding Zn-finger/Zn-ribbon topoisomerase 1
MGRYSKSSHWRFNQRQARESPFKTGEKTPVACPKCGAPMVRRERRSDGLPFLGCSRFPKCKTTKIPSEGI